MSLATKAATPPNDGDLADMASMKKLMLDAKVDGNKTVWTATLETFGMADGTTKKNDIYVTKLEMGVELFHEYANNTTGLCWDLVPMDEFKATRNEVFMAFLKWAEKDDGRINVSKALRRMEAYFEWMNDNRQDLQDPLTVASIRATAKIWDIQITYDDKGHFVWWIDLGGINRQELKKMTTKDHLRYVVWFAHLVMFDEKARLNGATIVEDLAHLGFWKLATLVPNELSVKMDRLTIGILPVKMKAIYVFGAATWMTILMTFMKPFMGKKMRERMILLPDKTDMQTFCDELVTRKNIPQGFCGLKGGAPRDAVLLAFAQK